jgi:hypothetical protein
MAFKDGGNHFPGFILLIIYGSGMLQEKGLTIEYLLSISKSK